MEGAERRRPAPPPLIETQEVVDPRRIATAAVSHVGRVRAANQDEWAEFRKPEGHRLLVVADGMGGSNGGEIASRRAVETIGEVFERPFDDAEEMLRSAFGAANETIHRLACETPGLFGMGTTAVALLFMPDGSAWVAHVGDSRLYRLHRGRLLRCTADHSWVAEEVRRGNLSAAEAEVHPQRNALLRSIGVDPRVEVDVGFVEVAPGDRLLLCSDGLWGELDEEIIASVLSGEDAEECARGLVELANHAGGHDNVTVQVAAVPGPVDTMRMEPFRPGPRILADRRRRRRRLVAAAVITAVAGAALYLGWGHWGR